MFVQHLIANNDRNGNPQRLWMIGNDEGALVKVIDEQHGGRPSEAQRDSGYHELWALEVTVSEYRAQRSFAQSMGILARQ